MQFHVLCVGRARPGPERDLFTQFSSRLPSALNLKEVEVKKAMPVAQRRIREAEMLLEAVPPQAVVIALDEKGEALSSMAFAEKIGHLRDEGVRDLAFIIGGADGLDASVREKSAFVLGFGALTWPHMLVRAMLAEQLYRAHSILTNHPYHRE